MGKKKQYDDDGEEIEGEDDAPLLPPAEPSPQQRRKGVLPALSIGDILALLTLIVLSAALLLEGYHKEFKDYSKEIIALFAVVVGFLLGRKS